MQVIRNVLPKDLNESLRLYWNGLTQNARHLLEYDNNWGGRHYRHDDPIFSMIHERLTYMVANIVGTPIKKSYVFTTTYMKGAIVPKHLDREQCVYTLDYCLESSGEPWPLHTNERTVLLDTNDALFYYGCKDLHWREQLQTDDKISMSFFHFVDTKFRGPLV